MQRPHSKKRRNIVAIVKKGAAILFCLLLGGNLWGYHLLLTGLQSAHAQTEAARIERAAYDEADLVSIKTVLHLPYYNSNTGFESVQGTVWIEGKAYNYVQRRVYNDTLEIRCLPDEGATALQHSKLKCAAPDEGGKQKGDAPQLSLPLVCGAPLSFQFHYAGQTTIKGLSPYYLQLSDGVYAGPFQPPCAA